MERIKFAAFSDLHLDIMHDGERRLCAFLQAAKQEKVDFAVQLGDFSYPEDTSYCACAPEKMPINLKLAMECPPNVPKKRLMQQYNSLPMPTYHVLGNHEMDFCSKQSAMAFDGITNPYYSFRCRGWHFIVLDGNHYRNNDGIIQDYWFGDYFESKDLPYLGTEQINWLEKELSLDKAPTVLFCHQPMWQCDRGLKDRKRIMDIFTFASKNGKSIKLCMSGHLHRDYLTIENHIIYYSLNSISNYWAGEQYASLRYNKDVDHDYPNLRYTLPYGKPLFAIITLDEHGMLIRGKTGRFVQPGPKKMGIMPMPSASIKSRFITWPE